MTASPDPWFSVPDPRPGADVRLFCLPYAGGAASVYRAWPKAFGPRVEVVAVQLPGREQRIRERPAVEPEQVASAIARMADRPYAIFGHSMGARLGFDVIRILRATGRPLPVRFYPSGATPPHVPSTGPLAGLSTMDVEEFGARLVAAGGVRAEVVAERELFELFLPMLRTDFAWVDGYTYTDGPPLPVPIVAFAGASDPVALASLLPGWREHTTESFTTHTLPGDHFFLHDRLPEMSALIEADLLTAA
jgi:surfactin synthase thioesterase subunit